jgi:hypothetical protein
MGLRFPGFALNFGRSGLTRRSVAARALFLSSAVSFATAAAYAQSGGSTYSCKWVQHVGAPPTRECTYESALGTTTSSCGYVEHLHGSREYRCSDTTKGVLDFLNDPTILCGATCRARIADEEARKREARERAQIGPQEVPLCRGRMTRDGCQP